MLLRCEEEKKRAREREREREKVRKREQRREKERQLRAGGGQTSEKRDGEKGTGISTRRGKKEGTRRREEHVRRREVAKESEGEATKKAPWCDWKTRREEWWKKRSKKKEKKKRRTIKKRRKRATKMDREVFTAARPLLIIHARDSRDVART